MSEVLQPGVRPNDRCTECGHWRGTHEGRCTFVETIDQPGDRYAAHRCRCLRFVDPALGPIGTEEMSVDQMLRDVHLACCIASPRLRTSEIIAGQHDPACNTARLLAEDHAHLVRTYVRRGRIA